MKLAAKLFFNKEYISITTTKVAKASADSRAIRELKDLNFLISRVRGVNFLRVRVVPDVTRIQIREFEVMIKVTKDRLFNPRALL